MPPRGRTALPPIVFVHGGAWLGGHARHAGAFESWPEVLASLAATFDFFERSLREPAIN